MSVAYDPPAVENRPPAPPPLSSAPPPLPPRGPRRNRWVWLAGLLLAGVVAVGAIAESLPPGTLGHPLLISLAGSSAPPAVAPAPAPAQTDPRLAAIQQVIQHANAEQVQALATQNPSVMSDTARQQHFQQMAQINQQLQAQGVTAIQLTNLNWGPITVNGDSATATSDETWVTTFSDGTTMQSTDTNIYTLVLQNGSWLISADQQPNTAPSQPQTTTPPAAVRPASNNSSRNWSGYAATGKTYTGVSATWTVPQPSSTSSAGVGATWIGIGGVNSRDLIQAGTQDVVSGSGRDQFQAWIETLPRPSQQVPLAVAPGDSVSVSITETAPSSSMWNISFKNNTSGATYQTTVRYQSSQSSAEWIEEAPASGNRIIPLDNFGSVSFSSASAVANGQPMDLSQAGAQPITMLNATGQTLAVPSTIGVDGSSFTVARTSASSTPFVW